MVPVARAPGLNPCSVRSSILSKCIQASSVPGPATCEKPLSFIEALQNGRMVVLPVRVVWSFGHRIGDLALHWALSILLPDEKRRSEENNDSSFWGMVTYMAVGGGRSAGWGARKMHAGPAAGVPRPPPSSPCRTHGRGTARAGLRGHRHRRQLGGRLTDELVGRGERGRSAGQGAGGHTAEPG